MFLAINNEVIGSLKWQNHASYPPLLLNVSWHERTVRCASDKQLIFLTIKCCYGKQVTVFAVAIAVVIVNNISSS